MLIIVTVSILSTSCVDKCFGSRDTTVFKNNTVANVRVKYFISQQTDSFDISTNFSLNSTDNQKLSVFLYQQADSVLIRYDNIKQKVFFKHNCVGSRNVLCVDEYTQTKKDKCSNYYTYTFTDADYAAADSIK